MLIDIAEEMAEEVAAVEKIDAELTAAATEGAIPVTSDLDETEALLGHPDRDKSPEPGVSHYRLRLQWLYILCTRLSLWGSELVFNACSHMCRAIHLVMRLLAPTSQQTC